jgi:hypothetical protein
LDVTLGREFLVGLICAGEFGDFRQIVTLDSVTLDRVDCISTPVMIYSVPKKPIYEKD